MSEMSEAIVLDGYLDEETLPGDLHGSSARFRIMANPTDERADELILPCSADDPQLAHVVIHDLQPGDLVRVTGYLRLPRTPDDLIWLQVQDLELLQPAPLRHPSNLGEPEEDDDDPDAAYE